MITASNKIYLDGFEELIRNAIIDLESEFSHSHSEYREEANAFAYHAILSAYKAYRIVEKEEVRSTMAYVFKVIAESIINDEIVYLDELLFPLNAEGKNEK